MTVDRLPCGCRPDEKCYDCRPGAFGSPSGTERQHCERVMEEFCDVALHYDGDEFKTMIEQLVSRERAAAFREGEAAGEQRSIDDSQKCIALQYRIITERTQQLAAIQAKHERLTAVVRGVSAKLRENTPNKDLCPELYWQWLLADALDAALSE